MTKDKASLSFLIPIPVPGQGHVYLQALVVLGFSKVSPKTCKSQLLAGPAPTATEEQ